MKLLLFIIFGLFSVSTSFGANVTFENPTGLDIGSEKEYGFVGFNEDNLLGGTDTYFRTGRELCISNGLDYVSENRVGRSFGQSVGYYENDGDWNDASSGDFVLTLVVCEEQIQTENVGVNKSVFTEDFITDILVYQAIIQTLIIFIVFMLKIVGYDVFIFGKKF